MITLVSSKARFMVIGDDGSSPDSSTKNLKLSGPSYGRD